MMLIHDVVVAITADDPLGFPNLSVVPAGTLSITLLITASYTVSNYLRTTLRRAVLMLQQYRQFGQLEIIHH